MKILKLLQAIMHDHTRDDDHLLLTQRRLWGVTEETEVTESEAACNKKSLTTFCYYRLLSLSCLIPANMEDCR